MREKDSPCSLTISTLFRARHMGAANKQNNLATFGLTHYSKTQWGKAHVPVYDTLLENKVRNAG